MGWTNPRTWVSGETVTAAIMNTHVRDNLAALSTWQTDWTPTWTGGTTNPTIGNGSIVGRYISAGKLVHWYAEITIGSTTTLGTGVYSLDLPVAEVSRRFTFHGHLFDFSASDFYPILGVRNGSDAVVMKVEPTTAGNTQRNFTGTVPVTLATSDVIFLGGTYEAA